MLTRLRRLWIKRRKHGLGGVPLDGLFGERACPPSQFSGPGYDCQPDPCEGHVDPPLGNPEVDAAYEVATHREAVQAHSEIVHERLAYDPSPDQRIGEKAVIVDAHARDRGSR